MVTLFTKQIPDQDFEKYKGTHFNEKWYQTVITDSARGYYLDPLGNKKVLFIFKRGVIPKELQQLAIDVFLKEAKKKHSNRGLAGGLAGKTTARIITRTGQNEGNYTASNISGYFDRPLRNHLGTFGTNIVCRTTSFTIKNKELWNKGLPFVQHCSDVYKRLADNEYHIQKQEYNKINKLFKIPKTVFTTITSNYNWRTACHCDSGDFAGGLGNLIVVGKNFTGGYLGFPQFKVLIKIKPGDFLLMDSHQWHCNTELKTDETSDSFRLSFVMYIRNDMSKCNTTKIIDGVQYLYHH